MTCRIASIVAVAIAALLPATPPVKAPATPAQAPSPAAVAEVRDYEVKLRKLYMVRPDLLQYPIPYDVNC